MKAARDLNYELPKNKLGTSRWQERGIRIAIITKHMEGEFYADFFNGFVEVTENLRHEPVLITKDLPPKELGLYMQSLAGNNFDAAVLFHPELKPYQSREILESIPESFPLISVSSAVNPVIDTITFDSYRGGYIVGQHFYDCKYQEVGIITGPTQWTEPYLRRNGFADFSNFTKNLKLTWEYEGDYSIKSGKDAFKAFDKLNTKPRAVFASNDNMSLGFTIMALHYGYNIPEDVAVCGYDDLEICSNFSPSLSSVHTDYKMLADNVINKIEDKLFNRASNNGQLQLLPISLKARESTGRQIV